jgi:energy-coupling factor transport system permease protein
MSGIKDPRIHLITLLAASIFFFAIRNDWQLHVLIMISVIYLLLNGKWRSSLGYALGYVAAFSLSISLPPSTVTEGIQMLIHLSLRTMPILMISSLFLSLPPSAFLWSGARMRLPQHIFIMFCVLLRYSSVLRIEMGSIQQGIRARGIFPRWYSAFLHPARAYECFVLPLIIRGLKLSIEITCAAQFRGLESRRPRSCIYPVGLRPAGLLTAGFYILCGSMILWTDGGILR